MAWKNPHQTEEQRRAIIERLLTEPAAPSRAANHEILVDIRDMDVEGKFHVFPDGTFELAELVGRPKYRGSLFGDEPVFDRAIVCRALFEQHLLKLNVDLAESDLRHLIDWFLMTTRRSLDEPIPRRMIRRMSQVFALLSAPAPPMGSADEFRLALDDARRRLGAIRSRIG